jgi:tetratricopeptide (TPR) repeat protein
MKKILSLSLFCLALPLTGLAQNSSSQQETPFVDEIIVTGKVRGGDPAMSAFLNGDFETAEIEFNKNLKNLIRVGNLSENSFLQSQTDQLSAELRNGPPSVGPSGGSQPAQVTPQSVNLTGFQQARPKPSEEVLVSGADKGFQLYMMGLSQIQLGKYEDAKTSFKRAIRLNKTLYDARTRLGLIYLSESNFDASREQLIALNKIRMACKQRCKRKEKIETATLTLAKEMAKL